MAAQVMGALLSLCWGLWIWFPGSPLAGQIALQWNLLEIPAARIITVALPSCLGHSGLRSHAQICLSPSRKGVTWPTGVRQKGFQAWKSLTLFWARDIFKLDFEKAFDSSHFEVVVLMWGHFDGTVQLSASKKRTS